jgi:hypothetical protein
VAYLPQRGEIDWRFPITLRKLVLTGRYVHLGWFKRPSRNDWHIADAVIDRECATHFEQHRSMADADKAAVCPTCASLLKTKIINAVAWVSGEGTKKRSISALQRTTTHQVGCACCAAKHQRF